MRTFYRTFTRLTAAAVIVAMSAAPGFAAKTTPATDKNTNVPAVPRAIPDLVPYHKFDPPAGTGMFDISKLTITGDLRVRPEFRNNASVGFDSKDNRFFTQQWIRMGFHYAISPDVVFFLQPQVTHNWGTGGSTGGAGDPNTTASDLYLRQGFMLVRNFLVPNLTLKAGRQLVVWGNHRMFGHFDWNNVGWAFDGLTFRYNHAKVPVEFGWLVVSEGNCGSNAGGCGIATGASDAGDGNILFVRSPMKVAGIAIEPAWIYEDQGSRTNNNGPGGQITNQSRHTIGGRIATKKGIVDVTAEGYWQWGSQDVFTSTDRSERINALAGHLDAGVTLPVPMQPRIGAEINYATGDSNCTSTGNASGCGNTFSQLFPTNHIHFGYMDLMSWQNMLTYGGNLQLRPTPNSHFEIAGHILRLADKGDAWYGANQAVFRNAGAGNDEKSLGGEIDVVYTLFFQGNKVGWQIGYGHFFTGDYISKNKDSKGTGAFSSDADQNWGYTQLWINF